MKIDVLVFCAHPDDAEISMGGTIAKFSHNGISVGIIDFSRGELSTRGNITIRKKESEKAAEILGAAFRLNLKLPDGSLRNNFEYVKKTVQIIREYKPKIIFAPYFNDRHPDHIGVSRIVKEAMFFSGVGKYKTLGNNLVQKSYRPQKLFYFMQSYEFKPSFIINISGTFDKKMEAISAFKSQFYNPESNELETFVSSENFFEYIKARAKTYGFKIGKNYGEAFFSEEVIELDLMNLLLNKPN